jgi:membrane-associated phospholipid phosphatase
VAIAWWIAGSAAGSPAQAAVGRDLVRAHLSVWSWTYAMKFAVDRTRPNGDPHSFPSGHASTSFTVATVLQEHFGWKVGVPAFAAAAYTGVTRVADNQHWASDVVFGAALGIASGRTVTIHLRNTKVSAAPAPIPGGLGVTFTAVR